MNKYSYPDEATSIPAFHLVRVQRKNNQKRRYAHVVPFLGKLAPVDHIQLNAIAVAAADAIHPLPEPALVIGLAEASLVLAWQLVEHLRTGEVELCFTTREENRHPDARSFQEPHSHGSIHWMRRPQRSSYRSVVIVEDEITTGNTITNLVLTLRNYAKEFVILTLADLRQSNVQGWMENVCASQGLSLMVKPLLSSNVALDVRQMHQPRAVSVPQPNPHARNRRALAQAVRRLTMLWQRHGPCTLYMVGECVDVPMAFCSSLPLEQRPPHPPCHPQSVGCGRLPYPFAACLW